MLFRLILSAIAAALAAAPAVSQGTPAYVGSETCAGCHLRETEAWTGSHHALAWTTPSPETVVADFDGTEFRHGGMSARFSVTPGGEYHVSVTETDGKTTEYDVHSVVGIEPLQQYVLETSPGRLQSFDIVWDTERGGWFHLYPDDDLPPDNGLHWTGTYKNWNGRCAECHATGFKKNYDGRSQTFASTQAEMGVGCEACHGPGGAHLAWAEGREYAGDGLDPFGLTMNFDDTEATIQQCAGCHSRREAYGDGNPLPGTPYHDAYNLSLLRPGLYQADGQILDEVYVYGSFLQSRMYAQGVGCGDCHDPHAARLKAEGNAVCTQCHDPEGRPDFPQAAGLYDSPEHHFHEAGSPGAQCRNCHMVERVYMGVDWRSDHSFRIPRPDLDAETQAPDACTTCHEDRSPEWAAETVAAWFPDGAHRGPHYGQTLARGRADPVTSAGALADLSLDTDEPGIVRATALWLLEQANSASTAERLQSLLHDEDPLVRAAAVGLQRSAPAQERVLRVVDLLDDPVRSVRIAAARALVDAPIAQLPDALSRDYAAAMAEWRQALSSRLDFPETHLQIGGTALMMRNLPAAFGAFNEAVQLDPQLVDAWSMLVRIAAASEGPEAARAVLDDALTANPGDPTLLQYDQDLGRQ